MKKFFITISPHFQRRYITGSAASIKYLVYWIFLFMSQTGSFDSDSVTEFINRFVPHSKLVEDIGTELTYQLPAEGAHEGTFATLFSHLDEMMLPLGITGYGISDTTLEEVFLKVAEDTGVDKEITNQGEFKQMWVYFIAKKLQLFS